MVFNSLEYFLFLPTVWLFYHFIGRRFRCFFLLIISYLFYASLGVPYLLGVLALVTLSSYWFGFWLHQAENHKKRILWLGISANLLILVAMKYIPFLMGNINAISSFLGVSNYSLSVPLLVAVGVSYFIFQSISYLIDIYLGIEEPEGHFGYFALYMSFFPKLLQGPIERAGDLLPQLKQEYEFSYTLLRHGVLLFSWGLFKKVVLADRLGVYVDGVYDDVGSYQGLPLVLATYAYAFQIYFDFSGYTDMALGAARLFNINLTNNFNRPYLAISVADFWRRWHITFSRWILDYIFKPLQMSWREHRNLGTAAALIVTFLVSGIWHGASWSFVFWGLLHGIYLASSIFYKPYQGRVYKALALNKSGMVKIWQVFFTFHLVTVSWVFFRSKTIGDALYIFQNLGFSGDWPIVEVGSLSLPLIVYSIMVLLLPRLRVNIDSNKRLLISDCFVVAFITAIGYMTIFSKSETSGFIYLNF